MNKAQQVRLKRIDDAIAMLLDKKSKLEQEAKIQEDAKKMIDFILNLFEKHNAYTSNNEVVLTSSPEGKVTIGSSVKKGMTDFPFNDDVATKVAEYFKIEQGYSATFRKGDEKNCSQLVIKMFI